jgi:hypothetical protein
MPLGSIIALSAIVAAFLLFAVVLAWVDHQTENFPRREELPSRQKDRQEIRPAA